MEPCVRSKNSTIPSEVNASHLIEFEVERRVETGESIEHILGHVGMHPSLGLAQAFGPAGRPRLLQTRKSLGMVEVEMPVRDDGFYG